MSTRSLKDPRRQGKTDPKWYPTTQGLTRWVNRMANRNDLTIRVLKHTSGAPARFVPAEAEVDVNEALISSVDPKIAGSPEFIVKHRAIAGAVVHESAHARFSTRINLPKIGETYGGRHAGVFAMLEEGRCETQQWENLSGVEKLALQSMVLEIVLRDMQNDDGEIPAEMNIQSVVRLMGLIAARIDVGIVDITQPMGRRLADALIDALGTEYAPLYDIAVRFARHHVSWYSGGDDDLHECVAEWIAVEDRLFPEPDEGEGGEGEGEGEGEGGEGSGKSKSKSPKGEDEGDGDGSGDGDDKSDDKSDDGSGDDGDESDKDGDGDGDGDGGKDGDTSESLPGDDDEGTVGDGSHTIDPDLPGEASLGDYASSNVDSGQFEDLFNAIRDAADEAEQVGGSRLREEVVAIHKATAAAHAERRRKNAAAQKRW